MHDLVGKISNISFSYSTGKPLITFEFDDRQSALSMANEFMSGDKLSIKVGKFRKKRSLDANAYCWVLIGKIAEKTGARVEDIYRQAIKEVGNYDIVCVKKEAVESLCSSWARFGIGWQTDTMPSKLAGCTNVLLYYGSSTFDSSEMSRLINIIVQDCESLGIETKSQEEIDSLLNSWRDNE